MNVEANINIIAVNIKLLAGFTIGKKYRAEFNCTGEIYWLYDDNNQFGYYTSEYFIDIDTYRYEKLKELYDGN